MNQSDTNNKNEMLQRLAEASGLGIPAERLAELAAIYKAIADDTRPVREADAGNSWPANVFNAE